MTLKNVNYDVARCDVCNRKRQVGAKDWGDFTIVNGDRHTCDLCTPLVLKALDMLRIPYEFDNNADGDEPGWLNLIGPNIHGVEATLNEAELDELKRYANLYLDDNGRTSEAIWGMYNALSRPDVLSSEAFSAINQELKRKLEWFRENTEIIVEKRAVTRQRLELIKDEVTSDNQES